MIERAPLDKVIIPNDGSVPDVRVAELPFVQISDDVRLYYKAEEHAFQFYAARWAGAHPNESEFGKHGYDGPDDIWKMSNIEVECLFHGQAYYDGLRHLYMGDKASHNEGYLYYGDTRELAKIFQELDRLETELLEPEMHHRT
jgi:hypothetical protein